MNNKRRKKNIEHQHLAALVYEEGMKKKIEDEKDTETTKRWLKFIRIY